MSELSQKSEIKNDDWAIQMWGYDVNAHRLVAYNFAHNGVFTKSVEGWLNGMFVSRRDDNGIIVSLKPINAKSMQWIVEAPDRSPILREECLRRRP